MSITHKFSCDICGSFWGDQHSAPDELLGISAEFADSHCKLVRPIGVTCKAHICKKCVVAIARQAVELSTVDYDFSKIR